jgi:hypothetical protein
MVITIPRLSFLKSIALSHEIKKLEATMLYLRQKALASGTAQSLYFQPAKHSYQNGENSILLHRDIHFGFLPQSKGPPSQPKKLISTPVTFKKNKSSECAIFHPDGTITPGTLYLIDSKKKYMQALTLSVGKVSFLRRYIYQKKKWVPIEDHQ